MIINAFLQQEIPTYAGMTVEVVVIGQFISSMGDYHS